MSRSRRVLPLVFVLAALAAMLSPGPGAGVAYADRCQPEEFVLGEGKSPLGQDGEDLRCPIMQAVVYDQVDCDDTKFMTCLGSLSATGTVSLQAGRVREICLVYDLIGCAVTVGDVIDTATGAGGGSIVPTGAVPQQVQDICLIRDLIGCNMTVGDVLNRLP